MIKKYIIMPTYWYCFSFSGYDGQDAVIIFLMEFYLIHIFKHPK